MYHPWTSHLLPFGWSPLGSLCLRCVCCKLALGFSGPRLMNGDRLEQAFGNSLLFAGMVCVQGRGGEPFANLYDWCSIAGVVGR